MKIYPNEFLNSVLDINIDFIKKNNIKGLILDLDNTLIDFNRNLNEEIINWCNYLKNYGIKLCILSNTNKVDKVATVAKKLNIHYFYFAKKPLKYGFKKAKKYLELDYNNIAVVGDQIFTDIIGANRLNMFSILVKPIAQKDILLTRIKRPIENIIIKRYKKKKNKGKIE